MSDLMPEFGDDYLRREDVFRPGTNVIPLSRRHQGVSPPVEQVFGQIEVAVTERTIIDSGEMDADQEPGLLRRGAKVVSTGLRLAGAVPGAVREILVTSVNQLGPGFDDPEFRRQNSSPLEVITSLETEHQVRTCYGENVDPHNSDHFLVVSPWGFSTSRGYMTQVAHTISRKGAVAWSVSPAGFEGNLPLKEVFKLSADRQAMHYFESMKIAMDRLGMRPGALHLVALSMGGPISRHIYKLAKQDDEFPDIGRILMIDPPEEHPQNRLITTARFVDQFGRKVPPAAARHIARHPQGVIRGVVELAPSFSLRPGAIKQMAGSAYQLTMKKGGSEPWKMDGGNRSIGDEDRITVIAMQNGIAKRRGAGPEEKVRKVPGTHVGCVDISHVEDFIDLINNNRQGAEKPVLTSSAVIP